MTSLAVEHLSPLASAPGGIDALRKLIRELAMRGQLLAQCPEDEVASQVNTTVAGPFTLPESWRWVALGAALNMVNGRAFKPSDWKTIGLPIVRIQNLNRETAEFNYADPEEVQPRHIIDSGTLLISWSGTPGTSFGAFIWNRGKAALNQHIFSCVQRSKVFADRFLQLAINTRLDELIAKAHGGVGLQHVTKGKLEALALALPPLAEQHRIVAKVDELMALCDRLEARQQDAETAHARLVQALLDSLTQARDAEESLACWRRVAGEFPEVFQTSASIDALQLSLYELAISGRLVEQRSEEEPASVALHNIREAKRRAGQPDAPARTKVVPDRDAPAADLPLGWQHARFADIALEVATGPFGSLIHQSDYQHGGVPLINPSHMVGGRIVADPRVALPPEKAQELSAYRLNEGDMVMARRGEVGRVALVSVAEHGWLCGTGSFRLRFTGDVHASFICLLFQAPSVRRYLAGAAVGTTMVNLNHGVLANLPVDLPPLAEQRRIVVKVTELLALCDQLKARIAAARAKHAQLAEALVAQAVAA